ncbi:hypothetical protein MBLNU459_g5868t1 [Dothideomycetes sp. NU459]
MKNSSGEPMRRWMEEIPNDGLIRYTNWLNSERVLLTNPKTLAEVLSTKNYEFIKPAHFRSVLGKILGVGVLLAEGDEHKVQRKNLMPAFHYRHVKDLYPVFWSKAKEMIDGISIAIKAPSEGSEKPSNVVEAGDWTSRATLDIIGVAGMGQDFGALKNPQNKLYQTYRTVFNPPSGVRFLQVLSVFLPPWFLRSLPLKRNGELQAASSLIKQTCRDLIEAKRAKMEKGERTEVDILSVAIESGGFTDEDLVNQLMTFLAAGHETTASSMTWALYMLCKHPEVQTKLREEIREKLPSLRGSDTSINPAQLDGCYYLNAVCNEVLRVWPPVGLTMRIAAEDSTINGQLIPKDTIVVLSPWAVNMNTKLWGDDAREFKPERWTAEGQANKGGADNNYSFLTFLHGPRSCIGQAFAKAEFASLLAAWVGRFETEFRDKDYVAEVKGGVTLKPKGGLWVRMREVDDW